MQTKKWTIALASLGLVTLSSKAEEPKLVPVTTALSATTISGYVDTSAVWNPGTGNANPAPYAFNLGKQDGFNLDSAQVQIQKPIGDEPWSAGYTVALMFGPDAPAVTGTSLGNGLGENLRTATVDLRAPVGNGLDFHIGRFNNIIGYESTESYKNPNWSRSYGWSVEPTEHTGVLAEYKFNDSILLDVGAANSVTTLPINYRSPRAESKKAVVSLLTLTAPKSWGFLADDVLYVGVDQGPGAVTEDRTHVYVGSTINTPLKDLTLGVGYDSVNHLDVGADTGYFTSIAGYASYKVTEKLTANVRGEYARGNGLSVMAASNPNIPAGVIYPGHALDKVFALTGTLSYDLWANVLTRLEARWDHAANGQEAFGGTEAGLPTKKDEFMIAANIVYKF